jgi:CrcB protein
MCSLSSSPPVRPPAALDGRELAAIFTGGVAGALARAGVEDRLPHGVASWPWATFAVNLLGAFALGLLATALQERLPPTAYRRPFVGTGLCGALTTFSTLQLELLRMVDAGRDGLAAGYAGASVAAGVAAVVLGTNIARRVA